MITVNKASEHPIGLSPLVIILTGIRQITRRMRHGTTPRREPAQISLLLLLLQHGQLSLRQWLELVASGRLSLQPGARLVASCLDASLALLCVPGNFLLVGDAKCIGRIAELVKFLKASRGAQQCVGARQGHVAIAGGSSADRDMTAGYTTHGY